MNLIHKIFIVFFIALNATMSFAQEQKFQLSSHILDVSRGLPAPEVIIKLEKQNADGTWKFISQNSTDMDGRVKNFLPYDKNNNGGIYKLIYFTKPYFESLEETSFYPFVEVVFEIKDKEHYHVPITLSAYGYSTYRGS